MGLVKGLRAEARRLARMIDWWVATQLLLILLLGFGILALVIRWLQFWATW